MKVAFTLNRIVRKDFSEQMPLEQRLESESEPCPDLKAERRRDSLCCTVSFPASDDTITEPSERCIYYYYVLWYIPYTIYSLSLLTPLATAHRSLQVHCQFQGIWDGRMTFCRLPWLLEKIIFLSEAWFEHSLLFIQSMKPMPERKCTSTQMLLEMLGPLWNCFCELSPSVLTNTLWCV